MGRWSGRGVPPTKRRLHRLRKKQRDEQRDLRKGRLALEKQFDRDSRRMKLDKMLIPERTRP